MRSNKRKGQSEEDKGRNRNKEWRHRVMCVRCSYKIIRLTHVPLHPPGPQDGWGSSGKLTLHYQHVHKIAPQHYRDCCCGVGLAVLFVQETPKPQITHTKAKNQRGIQLYINPHLSLEVNEQPFLRMRALGRLSRSVKISPLFLNTICSLIKSAQWLFAVMHIMLNPAWLLLPNSSTDPPAPSHRVWWWGSHNKVIWGGESINILLCHWCDLTHADVGEAQQCREGEAASSLCQATLYIPTVLGKCNFNSNCTSTITALTPVHQQSGASAHPILHGQISITRTQIRINHLGRVDSQAGGKEETENKRQKSPNQSEKPLH